MLSIKHYADSHFLPDFRNFGISLGVNLGVLAQSRGIDEGRRAMVAWAAPLWLTAGGPRTFSPALSEACLQALTACIRSRFLCNSLNAVLSLIRPEVAREKLLPCRESQP